MLDVLASSHQHLKTIARTRGSSLDNDITCTELGGGNGLLGGEGGGEASFSKLKLNPRPAFRWPALAVLYRLICV